MLWILREIESLKSPLMNPDNHIPIRDEFLFVKER